MQFTSNTVRKLRHSPLAPFMVQVVTPTPANDNFCKPVNDEMFDASLRLFAEHGLGAARAARHQAEQAFFSNDMDRYAWWLGICRLLDRRMAMIAAHKLEANR